MKVWVQHESWLNPDGRILCARCGIELPRFLPDGQSIYMSGASISLGPRADAVLCKLNHE